VVSQRLNRLGWRWLGHCQALALPTPEIKPPTNYDGWLLIHTHSLSHPGKSDNQATNHELRGDWRIVLMVRWSYGPS
jgi:hypothetical protein